MPLHVYIHAVGAALTLYFIVIPLALGWWRRRGVPRTVISVRVIADSINRLGRRITTFEGVFNRYLLAEFNTHRAFSRNSASSRAIPVKKMMAQVFWNPATPIHWGANQAGMQARAELSGWRRWAAVKLFLLARFPALFIVWLLTLVGLHKQIANRILEPWVWHTVVFTSTEMRNFFKLRLHPDAQPEFQEFARCCKVAFDQSTPRLLEWGEWHLPYITTEDWAAAASFEGSQDLPIPLLALMSSARCAAVSYVRQGERREPKKDIELSERLRNGGHWSPFEHVALACEDCERSGNFDGGWEQLRKCFPGEDGR